MQQKSPKTKLPPLQTLNTHEKIQTKTIQKQQHHPIIPIPNRHIPRNTIPPQRPKQTTKNKKNQHKKTQKNKKTTKNNNTILQTNLLKKNQVTKKYL